MTVQNVGVTAGPFLANGATTQFPFSFQAFDTSEIVPRVEDGSGNVLATPAFSVILGNPGGFVVFAAAPPSPQVIYILYQPTLAQNINFTNQGDYSAAQQDQALDRAAMRAQYDTVLGKSAIRGPLYETLGELPPAAKRAGMGLAFDSSGAPIVAPISGGGDSGGAVTSVAGRTGAVTISVADLGSANLTAWAAKSAPAGNVLGNTDVQTLTNKTISASANTIADLTTASFAAGVVDTDVHMSANSDTRIPSQKAVAAYVNTHAAGFHFLTGGSVACATTANITLSGEQTLDGVLTSTSRVLVKNQTDATTNGVYVSAAGAWSRASDANTGAQLASGAVLVTGGSTQAGTTWEASNLTINLGTDSISYIQSGAGATYTAGAGLALTGTSFAVQFGTTAGTAAQGNDSRITGAAQKANNLSDLASARTGLTNLGVPTTNGDLSISSTGTVVSKSSVITNIAAATTMNIVAAGSKVLYVTGQTTLDGNGAPAIITSLGPCDPSNDKPVHLIFAAFNRIACDGVHLIGGQDSFLSVQPNGSILATPVGTDAWHLQMSSDAMFRFKESYIDQSDVQHLEATNFGSPNHYDTAAPDFRWHGSDNVGKLWTTSLFLNCAVQGSQIGHWAMRGTAETPTGCKAGDFVHRFYWPYDGAAFDCAIGLNCLNEAEGMNDNQYFDYSGRSFEEMYGNYADVSSTDRSGWYAFGLCGLGQASPVGHQAYLPDGGRISYGCFGRDDTIPQWNYATGENATYEYPIPWTDYLARNLGSGEYASGGRRGLFPAGWNTPEVSSVANDMFLVADKSRFAAAYWAPDPSFQSGWKLGYDSATGSMVWGSLSGGSVTWGFRLNPNGAIEGSSDGQISLGESTNRFGAVYAQQTITKNGNDGTNTQLLNSAGSFTSDMLFVEAQGVSPSSGFNMARFRASGDTYARIDGNGKGYFDGGTATSGAGFGEYYEWADGNPQGDDRSGWSVCLIGDKIVRASDQTDLPVIGVVSRRLAHVGDAASHHHHGKWQTDSFGRRLSDPVEFVEWEEPQFETVTRHAMRSVTKTVTRPKTRRAYDERTLHRVTQHEDGTHRLSPHKHREPVDIPITELQPLHDADGQPVTTSVTRHAPDAEGKLQPVLGPDGQPVVDQVQKMVHVPVMETVELPGWEQYEEEAQVPAPPKLHSYRANAVPEGVTVPDDAKRVIVQVPRLHPDHDPERPYQSREERQEWDAVSYLGKELVLAGERVGDTWIKMRAVTDGVEEWLVFPPAPPAEPSADLIAAIVKQVRAEMAA